MKSRAPVATTVRDRFKVVFLPGKGVSVPGTKAQNAKCAEGVWQREEGGDMRERVCVCTGPWCEWPTKQYDDAS